ncbi:MAG: dihydrodipicolinate synthase family protein [Pseudomonadota bacterium]
MAEKPTGPFKGVIAPVATPFDQDGAPDSAKFVEHATWLIEDGCHGLAPFGTTSEGNAIGLDERMELLEDLVEAGIEPKQLMPGTGMCSVADTVMLNQHAVDLGCPGVLMLPPFYYKNPSDEGLLRYFAEVIEQTDDDDLRIYLYHIPQMSSVGFSLDLIRRLREEFPDTVVGLKDSSGDWANMQAMLDAFPGFDLFPGSEGYLLKGLQAGTAGVISASANVNARSMRVVYDAWERGDVSAAEEEQVKVSAVRAGVQAHPLVPVVKAMIAHYRDDPMWAVPRPPLETLDADVASAAIAALEDETGFRMRISIGA